MDDNPKLQTVSLQLYQYLRDFVLGSESMVRYRRLFYKVFDYLLNTRYSCIISSGSRAEGLDLPGSDFDVMYLNKSILVNEDDGIDHLFVMDTDNAQPGFTLIRVPNNSFLFNSNIYDVVHTEYGYVLSNESFKDWPQQCPLFYVQGPSLTEGLTETDHVQCFRCYKWPRAASRWLQRKRLSGWPNAETMESIIYDGVLIVPIGSKFSGEENSLEWRFSFSLSEKRLIHSLNHTQLMCYSLLKILLKEIINEESNMSKLLCSYYMKTLVFWVMEEVNNSEWVPKKLLKCFRLCIQRLHAWILCNYIPNYFIPEQNMIDGKLSEKNRNSLCVLFEKLLSQNDWTFLLTASSLKNFSFIPNNVIETSTLKHTKCNAILSCSDIPLIYLYTFGSLNEAVARIYSDSSKTIREFFALSIPWLLQRWTPVYFRDCLHWFNKDSYKRNKEVLPCLLVGVNGDALVFWVLLALFFFHNKEYRKVLQVLRVVSDKVTLKLSFLKFDKHLSFVDISKIKRNCHVKSMFNFFRQELTSYLNLASVMGDLFQFLPVMHIFLLNSTPSASLYYLTFLCHFELGNSRKSQMALESLRHAVELSTTSNEYKWYSRFASRICLLSAYKLSIEKHYDKTNHLNFQKLIATFRNDVMEKLRTIPINCGFVEFLQHFTVI